MTFTRNRPAVPPEARVWKFVQKTDGCWLWTGALVRGYGSLCVTDRPHHKRTKIAHRVIYELLVGPIPPGLELDHLCRVRNCVNPDHLEPVTHAENMRRGHRWQSAKTHCPRGHPYSGDNLLDRSANGMAHRVCRTCNSRPGRRARQTP